jgi:hypothetical protein
MAQLMALLHLSVTHLSTVLFVNSAYAAQDHYTGSLGVIILASLFGLIGSVFFLLARDVGLLTADLRLYQEDGMPAMLRPPTSKVS